MSDLNGYWNVERTGGLLPPMLGVRKRIDGAGGVTTVGPARAGFDVVGNELRYRGVLTGWVDVLSPSGAGFSGIALYRGRRVGRFRLQPIKEDE